MQQHRDRPESVFGGGGYGPDNKGWVEGGYRKKQRKNIHFGFKACS